MKKSVLIIGILLFIATLVDTGYVYYRGGEVSDKNLLIALAILAASLIYYFKRKK